MKKLLYILICLIGIALSECKTSSKSAIAITTAPAPAKPTAADVKPAAPDTLALAIASGQTVYQAKCGGCHDLPRASEYGYSEWSNIMIKMSRKAHLSDTETDQVLAYVHSNAKP